MNYVVPAMPPSAHAPSSRARFLPALCIALLGIGCSTTDGAPGNRADAGTGTLEARLDVLQEHVFTPGCAFAGCHDEATRAGALDLSDASSSYRGLLNRPVVNAVASENGWLLVKPGDPELSFLVRKLRVPGLGEGAPMPIGDYQVSEFYLDLIVEWIALGAQP